MADDKSAAQGANPKPGLQAAIIPVTPFEQNCTILWDETTMVGAVVDPGGDVDQIVGAIAEIGVRIEKILLTHGHIDHAGGAMDLKAKLGATLGQVVPIEGPHLADKFLLDGLEAQGRQYGFAAKNATPDRWLVDGDKVTVAGHTFDCLHCPGHSPGSIVMVNKVQNFAMMGDVLFKGSVGRTDFPYGNTDDLITAITTKILPLGDDMAFICGHGPTSTVGNERASNPYIRA
jgi:hydroxyacylglutathione hydrolase